MKKLNKETKTFAVLSTTALLVGGAIVIAFQDSTIRLMTGILSIALVLLMWVFLRKKYTGGNKQ